MENRGLRMHQRTHDLYFQDEIRKKNRNFPSESFHCTGIFFFHI